MENKLIAKGTTTDLDSYTFSIKTDEPIIVITEDGFKYKGELIEDKGEIYQLFKNYLTSSQTEISDEEIEKELFDLLYDFEYEEIPNSALYKFDYDGCAKALTKWYREQLKQKNKNYERRK